MIETRTIKYFLAVAQEKTISGAAKVLHITQPTLSRQLIELEKELDVELFERSKNGITLTPSGLLLKQRSQEIIDLLQLTESEIKAQKENISGEIRIGCGESLAIDYIADIIATIQNTYPNVSFAIESGDAENLCNKLEHGLLDFGLLFNKQMGRNWSSITLPYHDTVGLLAPANSQIAQRKTIRLCDLKDLPLIIQRRQPISLNLIDIIRKATQQDPHIVATYNLAFNASRLVLAGIGYAIIIDNLINVDSNTGLAFIPFDPAIDTQWSITWKAERIRSSACQLFIQQLYQKFEKK